MVAEQPALALTNNKTALKGGEELLERELRACKRLIQGYQDCLNGNVMSADKADEKIRRAKGWLSGGKDCDSN